MSCSAWTRARAATTSLPEHVVLLVRLHDVLLLHALEGEGGGGVSLALEIKASNEGSLRFHNHREGPYWGLPLVGSFHIEYTVKTL